MKKDNIVRLILLFSAFTWYSCTGVAQGKKLQFVHKNDTVWLSLKQKKDTFYDLQGSDIFQLFFRNKKILIQDSVILYKLQGEKSPRIFLDVRGIKDRSRYKNSLKQTQNEIKENIENGKDYSIALVEYYRFSQDSFQYCGNNTRVYEFKLVVTSEDEQSWILGFSPGIGIVYVGRQSEDISQLPKKYVLVCGR